MQWGSLQLLLINPDRTVRLKLPLHELERLWWRYRHEGVPLQYLVGRCPWRDMELVVAPGILIPRQETELLVDLAFEKAALLEGSHQAARQLAWADLGTGSGAIAVALARALPGWRGSAVDAAGEALRQAESNLRHLAPSREVAVRRGDWWQPLQDHWGQLDLVLANPPYIPSAEVDSLEPSVRDHEPRSALDGGADGLNAIRSIAADSLQALAPGGWLLLEHHHDQSDRVRRLLRDAGLVDDSSAADLEGRQRFALARRPSVAKVFQDDRGLGLSWEPS